MQPAQQPLSSSLSDNVPGVPANFSGPNGQQGAPEPTPPPVGTAPPATLVAQAAQGRRGSAWRLFHWLNEENREAIEAVRSYTDARLFAYFLEWLALGTWAGKTFKLPAAMRQPHFRTLIRTLFLPGVGASADLAKQLLFSSGRDPRPEVRQEAAHLLGLRGEAGAAPHLLAALNDEKPGVRVQAAKALGRLGVASAAPALVGALRAHDEELASQVRHALLHIGPQAVPALLEGARSPDAWVRWHALRALGELHDVRGVPALVKALADPDHAVAWMAARELTAPATSTIESILHLLLSAPSTPWLMETAAYVLHHQPNRQLKPILEPVIRSTRDVDYRITVPMAAERALEEVARMAHSG
jgi:hypothetical protein